MAKKFKEKKVKPDPKYNDMVVSKFINHVMKRGEKFLARKIVYNALEIAEKKSGQNGRDLFLRAINNVAPDMEVRPQRVGGATYQVPRGVSGKRRISLAIRWLLEATRKKSGKAMEESLAEELLAASREEGEAIRKKINTHKMAEANKAFSYLAK